MARPENPAPPMSAADCRAILADQISKSNPNSRRSIDTTRLLDTFEEEDRRTAKAAEDALRKQEAQASLQASAQWREETTAAIRKEIESEQAVERALAAMRDTRDGQVRDLSAQNKTLQEQVATLKTEAQTTATSHKNELARLNSELSKQQADYHALNQYNLNNAELTVLDTMSAEDIERELAVLRSLPPTDEQVTARRSRRMTVLLKRSTELMDRTLKEQDDARQRLQ